MKKHGGTREGSGSKKKYTEPLIQKRYYLPESQIPLVTAFVEKIKVNFLTPKAKTNKALKEANHKQNLQQIDNLDEFLNKL